MTNIINPIIEVTGKIFSQNNLSIFTSGGRYYRNIIDTTDISIILNRIDIDFLKAVIPYDNHTQLHLHHTHI